MQVDFLTITAARIRPRLGWGNAPDMELVSSEPLHSEDELYTFTIDEDGRGIYWCQMEGGFTSFLYCTAPILQQSNGRWVTMNNGGYYGRTFPRRVLWNGEVVPVDIVGPWSGGCYIANKVLPKPACEVSINGCHGICLTLECIRNIIHEFNLRNWSIDLDGKLGALSPEFRYRDLLKDEWTDEIKDELKELNLDGYDQHARERLVR